CHHAISTLTRCAPRASCLLHTITEAPSAALSTLSLHDALPIFPQSDLQQSHGPRAPVGWVRLGGDSRVRYESGTGGYTARNRRRSEEHTSELQSREKLVCRLLLEKKNKSNEDGHTKDCCQDIMQ